MSEDISITVDDKFELSNVDIGSVTTHTQPIFQVVDMSTAGCTLAAASNTSVQLAAMILNGSLATYKEYETVAPLLADNTLSYVLGTRNSVIAGSVIRCTTECFAYSVASSGASDHDITTVSGIKLYVKPIDGAFHIDAFGATGDGATNDTTAFQKFRLRAIAKGGAVTLNFSQGKIYMVADPYWPCDIPRLTVNGNGSSLKNNATDNKDKLLLVPSNGLDKDGIGTFYTPSDRYPLNTTTVGSLTITTTTAAHAGNFSAGEWVMIGSFDLQFSGQPPNYRFFEYHEVSAIDSGTGTITLRQPVKYAHQNNFPYTSYANGDGRANVYKIEQGTKWNINHTYNDITFVKNAVSASGACAEGTYCTGRLVTFNRCISPYFLPTQAGTVIMNACLATEGAEWDKLVEEMVLNDCEFRTKAYAASSINAIRATRTVMSAGYEICPKSLEMIDCTVTAPSQSSVWIFGGYGAMDSLIIRGGSHQFLPNYTNTTTQTVTVTIGSGGVIWDASSRSLTVPLDASGKRDFVAKLFPGAIIATAQSYLGADYPIGNFGMVRSIEGSLGSAVAVIDFASVLAGTEQLVYFLEPRHTSIELGKIARDYTKFAHSNYVLRDKLLTSAYLQSNTPVLGRLKRFVVDVKRPYTGATDGNIVATFQSVTPGALGARLSLAVNLTTIGRRESTPSHNSGWVAGGGELAGENLAAGSLYSTAFGAFQISASTMASANDGELPLIDFIMEFESPYN